jgi:hypothetical protein
MGIFPDRLKYAVIQSLYKNGNMHDVCNYRPASLLTSKLLKNVKQSSILRHLTKHNFLSIEQCGFITKLKTDNATFKLTTKILNAMNNKLIAGGIFCDLEKACDCINHDILLAEFKNLWNKW